MKNTLSVFSCYGGPLIFVQALILQYILNDILLNYVSV